MKIALWIAAGLVLLLLLAYWRGASLPAEHEVQISKRITAPLKQVAARIADLRAQPRWRRGVSAIDILESTPEGERYRENGSNGALRFYFQLLAATEDSRLFLSRIDDPELPFSGEWTISLSNVDGSTEVSIREVGAVRAPLFRFVAHDLLGYERTIRAYLEDLQDSFKVGEEDSHGS